MTGKAKFTKRCDNCAQSYLSQRKKGTVTICALARRVVLPNMAACQYWGRKYENGE